MLTALAEGQTVTSALQTVQVQAWRLTSEVNPDDMAMFVQTTSSLLQSITEHVQQGTLLVEVQHFLDIANEAHRVSKPLRLCLLCRNFVCCNVRLCSN